ncbi:MAG: hypothetical protein LBL86_01460 [Coriobacteriales bacterium]|jgi:hypothetical protein|nr:hypothetical protein [Coriobacteriales bacterium]
MSQEREPHNGFEKSATLYLEAAQAALLNRQPRLAVHLFRAAFEVESSFGRLVSAQVLDGMRKAWDLAFEMGDRSVAESLFTDLVPYNSPEQNEQATMRLQALALGQLESMGVTEDDLESIADTLSHEMSGADDGRLLDSLKSVLEQIGMSLEADGPSQAIQKLPSIEAIIPAASAASAQEAPAKAGLARLGGKLRERDGRPKDGERPGRLDYQVLTGYDRALAHMSGFGFLSSDDSGHHRFIERSAAMHGLPRLSLDGAFLFFGPSREDVSLFAHATAGEIGFPMLHVSVDLDRQGNGTIKLVGPFKRGFFGSPPDFMDMVLPCTVLIENIDHLQEMFDNEQQAIRRNGGRGRAMMGGPGRSMQAEVTGYLRALSNKPGIVLMATAQHTAVLREPLRGLLGPTHDIEVGAPVAAERRDVLVSFAGEHPSFAELDVDRIARLSEGLSRNDLVFAAHSAVESAYRDSLRTGRYTKVTIGDVMVQLSPYLDHDSPLYQQVEDEAVAQFVCDLRLDDDM